MRLDLKRKYYTSQSTIGELYVDGNFECFTLEDPVRPPGEKIAGKTAIPAGLYRVTITYSPKYRRPMPLVNDVPNYVGIRIHVGNFPRDTDGCILVGLYRDDQPDCIRESTRAFNRLYSKLQRALTIDTVVLNITNDGKR